MQETFKKLVSGQSRGMVASCARAGLWILSKPYAAAVTLRNWGYDRGLLKASHVPIPVISIGNLTVGGTGKTPAVAMIAKWFRARDIRVAILSRGYRRGEAASNDEAMELELSLPDVPHLQNPDRVASASIAYTELESELLLLDDGFQHRRLQRDLEVVLLDALVPFGYGRILPYGLLREPLRSIRRADVVMITRADQVDASKLAEIRLRVQRWTSKAAWVETEHRPTQLRNHSHHTRDLNELSQKKVIAFCGIGNPAAFLATLKDLQANVVDSRFFNDHHRFTREDIEQLTMWAQSHSDVEAIVCTGKDLPKIGLDHLSGKPLWCLEIDMRIRFGADALEDRLQSIVERIEQQRHAHRQND